MSPKVTSSSSRYGRISYIPSEQKDAPHMSLPRLNRSVVSVFLALLFISSESVYVAQASTAVTISGLATKYGPGEKVSYKISGTAGDSCQLSYQNQTGKPFTMGSAGSVTASFTTGPTASVIVVNVTCTQSGSARAQSQIVLSALPAVPAPTPTQTPTSSQPLPGVDASVNSTLSSIIEPLTNTCEEGELATVRADGLAFSQGDNVKVNIFNAANQELSLSLVTKSALRGETSIGIKVRVCQADPAYLGASQDYRLVATYSDAPGYFVQSQEYKFRLISRTEVANFSQYAVSQVRSKCVFDNNSVLNSYVQSGVTRKAGEKMTIKGTFYRAGLIAPNDTLSLVRVVDKFNSKIIATATTDKDGKYSFAFAALTFPKALLYQIQAPERQADIGVVPGPFPAKTWDVYIDCKKGCKIQESSTRDQAPPNNFTDVCLQSLSFYNQVIRQSDDENSRILRRVVIYPILSNITRSRTDSAAKVAAAGAAAAEAAAIAQNSNNNSGAASGSSGGSGSSARSSGSSSGGGSCYVSGYTTKKGKRVSGYYRRC